MMRQNISLELEKKSRSGTDVQQRDTITLWQQTATAEAQSDEHGLVAQLVRVCDETLLYIASQVSTVSPSERHLRALRRHRIQLKLWADGHGVPDGSLDKILVESKHLQYTTLTVLNSLCKTLSKGLTELTDASSNDVALVFLRSHIARTFERTRWLILRNDEFASESSSDSDSIGSENDLPQSPLADLAEEVKALVGCLFDLSAALERPATDPKDENEPSALDLGQRAAHDYHADLIKAKYPDAQLELVECLGRTSWNRYRRMQQERERNAEAAQVVSGPSQSQTAAKSQAASSNFKDSGMGSSIPSVPPARYAETVVSFITGVSEGKRGSIPTLSAEARKGEPFDCSACGRQLSVTSNRDWRQHLYLDLQPYTCFHVGCDFSTTPFANRQLWSQHLELDHAYGPEWNSVKCPLCRDATTQGKSAILIHFARHMEDIALAAIPQDVESDEESNEETDEKSTMNSAPSGISAAHASSLTAHLLTQINDGHRALSPVSSWAMGTPRNEDDYTGHSGSRSWDSDDEIIPGSAHHMSSTGLKTTLVSLAVPFGVSHRLIVEQGHLEEAQYLLRTNPKLVTRMDPKPFHPQILNDSIKSNIPPEVKTWAQLKQLIAMKPNLLPELDRNTLPLLQALQSLNLEILPEFLPETGSAESSSEHHHFSPTEDRPNPDALEYQRSHPGANHGAVSDIFSSSRQGSSAHSTSVKGGGRRESNDVNSDTGRVSWGGTSVGSWIKDDIVLTSPPMENQAIPSIDEMDAIRVLEEKKLEINEWLRKSNALNELDERDVHGVPSQMYDKAVDIELRCLNLKPPIPTSALKFMPSYQTAIKTLEPLDDFEWSLLEPRLLSELPAAEVERKQSQRSLNQKLYSSILGRPNNSPEKIEQGHENKPVDSQSWSLSCSDCKLRKVKCDGKRPDCSQCTRAGKQCQYSHPSASSSVIESPRITGRQAPVGLYSTSPVKPFPPLKGFAPLDQGVDAPLPEAIVEAKPQAPLRKGNWQSAPRSKSGCWICRRRKKRCDEAKPACDNCTRGGFVCEEYAPNVTWFPESRVQPSIEPGPKHGAEGSPFDIVSTTPELEATVDAYRYEKGNNSYGSGSSISPHMHHSNV